MAENYQIWFGATVSARSVKIVRVKTTERDSWWQELRKEIEKNVQAVNCTHVLGYRELLTVCDSVMILSASGTAIKVKKTHSSGPTVARLRLELHQFLHSDRVKASGTLKRQHSTLGRERRSDSADHLSPEKRESSPGSKEQRMQEHAVARLVKVSEELAKFSKPC